MKQLFLLLTLGAAVGLAACSDSPGSPDDAAPACTPSGLYCGASEMCSRGGRCDGPGECVTIPTTCDGEPLEEVCGCDGQLYESLCAARLVSVDTSFGGAACQ